MRPMVPVADRREKAVRLIEPRTAEQKQRDVEERALTLKKEQLLREIKFGALNTKRYKALWREMMMRIKMPHIIENIEVAWRNFDRALDIKDYRISFLMDELAEAEEQYQRNLKSHTEIIDQLLRTYNKKMQREEKNYQNILNETLDQTNAEIDKIKCQQNEDEIFLQSVIRGIHRQQEESLNNVKSVTLSKIDAFMEQNKDSLRISAARLENKLQNLWEDLRRILSDYQDKTKERRKCYEIIKEKDEGDQQVIAQQLLRTTNLFDEIRKLRDKITMYEATAKKDISEILMEHDFFQKNYWTIKNRFLSEQSKDKDQLKILSIEYNKTIKYLESLTTKSKRLLTLMQICRKYETQSEKIIPFAKDTELQNTLMLSSLRISILPDWQILHQIYKIDLQDLMNFWRRLGTAQMITMQLRSERDKLKIEANHLRECINCYMKFKKEE